MLSITEIAEALSEMGIDTKEKFKAFLAPAAIAASLRKKEELLEQAREDYEADKQEAAAAHSAAIAALESEITALKSQLNG